MAGGMIGGGRNGRSKYRPMAEINVTPMVDVMLVLLIIFMVAAPLMTSGVDVDLPKTDAKQLNSDSTPLTVSIKADGSIWVQDQQVDGDTLVAKLGAIAANDMTRRIFVRGDRTIPYGQVLTVMAKIGNGGFTKVALLAEGSGAGPTPPGKTTP